MPARALLLLEIWLTAASARAELCPAPPGNETLGSRALGSEDAGLRLSFLLRAMDQNARHLHTWSLIWGTTYAAATAAQLSAIPFVPGGVRIDLTAGAIAAAVGSASLYLLPLRITAEAHFTPDDLANPDRCALLAEVERRFFDSAGIDSLSASWIAHAGNVAVNAALALVLGLGFGRWTSAGISAAVGLAVGEANLLTQPHGLVSARARYLAGEPLDGPLNVGWCVVPMLGPSRAGLSIVLAL